MLQYYSTLYKLTYEWTYNNNGIIYKNQGMGSEDHQLEKFGVNLQEKKGDRFLH